MMMFARLSTLPAMKKSCYPYTPQHVKTSEELANSYDRRVNQHNEKAGWIIIHPSGFSKSTTLILVP
jgi:hypothetical protein